MVAELGTLLRDVLAEALPDVFGGAAPPVTVALRDDGLQLGQPADGAAAPRPEDRVDRLPVDPAATVGPYRLAAVPDAGTRVVRLRADGATVATLRAAEVLWNPVDPAEFTIAPLAHRSLDGVDEVEVLYSVTAVAVRLRGSRAASLVLTGDAAALDRVRALAVAVLTLERDRLVAESRVSYEQDGYGSTETLQDLRLVELPAATAGTAAVSLRLDVEVEARRALRPDEGVPIRRVLTPGAAGTGGVAVDPRVQA